MEADISEVPHIPHRRDKSFYIALFLGVLPVWGVVPLSWLYVLYHLSHWTSALYTLHRKPLLIYALCEVAFSIYYQILTHQISGPSPNPAGNIVDLQNTYKRLLQSGLAALDDDSGDEESIPANRPGSPAHVIERLTRDDPRAVDFRNSLRPWFRRVPWSHVSLENIRAWLYWSTFNASIPPDAKMPQHHRTAIDEAVELLEMRVGCRFPKETNPSVKPLLLTIDPLNVCARPLGWYLFVFAANLCIRQYYHINHDLQYGRFRELEYLIRIPPEYSRRTGPEPIVFLHGLGLGVFQYQQVLSHFCNELPDTPFLIPIQPQISQDIFNIRYLKPMARHEKVACLVGLLQKLGWIGVTENGTYGITLLSHSNGSYAHTWMLKSCPEIVSRSCFVDPVAFCSWEGDVCYNFVYKPCTNGVELVIRYFVGTELGVANLLQRHFDWLNNSLWFEEIPNACDPERSTFLLGGADVIVDADRVRRYLRTHGVRKGLWLDPHGKHGQALLVGGKGMDVVLDWLKNPPAQKNAF